MSCILLDDRLYASVLHTLQRECLALYGTSAYELSWQIPALRQWNGRAYAERYEETMIELWPLSMSGAKILSKPGLYKALCCIDYQCTDAQGYEGSDAHRWMVRTLRALASHIILDLPDAQAIQWASVE